jgi:hypothetical protein
MKEQHGISHRRTVKKRQQKGPELNNGIRNRGLKEEVHLGSKDIFYEVLGQTIGLEIVK